MRNEFATLLRDHVPDRLTAIHREQLHGRGLSDPILNAADLRSLTADDVMAVLKFNPNRSAGLGIPFFHPVTGEIRMLRVRSDIAPVIDGKPAKYLSPKGAGNLLYFPPNCLEQLKDISVPLYITEGEFKTLAAWQAGLLTLGMVGVWGWKGKGVHGQSQPIADLDLINCRDRIVTIVFDSDAAINPDVQRARYALSMEAYRRGAKTVYSVNFPAPEGIKVDFDSFLLSHGIEAFLDLDLEEIPSPYPRLKIWSLAELRATNLERPAAIVPGWGIREKGKVILTGAGGRGKSVLLLQLACHLAAGTPLLHHSQLTVTSPQRVLLYMVEDPIEEIRFRLLEQTKELGYRPEIEERIHILDFADRKPQLLTDQWALRVLADRIRQHRSTIVMLDPFVSLHDRDENSNSQMRAVLDATASISEETGCTFILAHHEPKVPENHSAASRGASAIRDWCRTMLRLTSHGDGDGDTKKYTLTLDKANYGGSVWSLPLERKQDSYIFTVSEEGTLTPLQVWEIIGPEERWFSEVLEELIRSLSVSESTAARAIKKAEELGFALVDARLNPKSGRKKKTIKRGSGPTPDGETAEA
jgi:hypothetical protein